MHQIPLSEIDTTILTRDRTHLAPEPLAELQTSILRHGLRMPVELLRLTEPRDHPYTLISGLRRLTVFRTLAAQGLEKFQTIPALIRENKTLPEAYTEMIEENAIRADLSPYEQGRIAVEATTAGAFETTDEAITTLYASCTQQKRSRLRAMAELCEELGGFLSNPEAISFKRGIRITNACRMGHTDAMRETLAAQRTKGAETDWKSLLPYIEAAETDQKAPDALAPEHRTRRPNTVQFYKGAVTIRKQKIAKGFSLHITGESGTSDIVESMLDDLERLHGEIER